MSKKIGKVAYTLQLPSAIKIHPTFHVSLLKKHHGPIPTHLDTSIPINWGEGNTSTKIPVTVLEKRSIKRNNRAVFLWLIL